MTTQFAHVHSFTFALFCSFGVTSLSAAIAHSRYNSPLRTKTRKFCLVISMSHYPIFIQHNEAHPPRKGQRHIAAASSRKIAPGGRQRLWSLAEYSCSHQEVHSGEHPPLIHRPTKEYCNRNTVTSRDVHLQKTETCSIINLTSCLHSSLVSK